MDGVGVAVGDGVPVRVAVGVIDAVGVGVGVGELADVGVEVGVVPGDAFAGQLEYPAPVSGGEDHTAQILLDIENRDGGNHPEVERRPGVAAVGRSENADVGRGQHGRSPWDRCDPPAIATPERRAAHSRAADSEE